MPGHYLCQSAWPTLIAEGITKGTFVAVAVMYTLAGLCVRQKLGCLVSDLSLELVRKFPQFLKGYCGGGRQQMACKYCEVELWGIMGKYRELWGSFC